MLSRRCNYETCTIYCALSDIAIALAFCECAHVCITEQAKTCKRFFVVEIIIKKTEVVCGNSVGFACHIDA